MEIDQKNQSNNNFEDVIDLFEIDYAYENKPIKSLELTIKNIPMTADKINNGYSNLSNF